MWMGNWTGAVLLRGSLWAQGMGRVPQMECGELGVRRWIVAGLVCGTFLTASQSSCGGDVRADLRCYGVCEKVIGCGAYDVLFTSCELLLWDGNAADENAAAEWERCR